MDIIPIHGAKQVNTLIWEVLKSISHRFKEHIWNRLYQTNTHVEAKAF